MQATALQWTLIGAGVGLAGLAAGLGWRHWQRHAADRALLAKFEAVSADLLRSVMLPDTGGGLIHCDFVLLSRGGLVVVDLRDVRGMIFGGRHMDEWTVMDGHQRRTFDNPIEGLHDRVAAVKQLAGEAPVEGMVVFTARGRFPKGLPPHAALLDALAATIPPIEGHAEEAERWREAFAQVREASQPSRLGRG